MNNWLQDSELNKEEIKDFWDKKINIISKYHDTKKQQLGGDPNDDDEIDVIYRK